MLPGRQINPDIIAHPVVSNSFGRLHVSISLVTGNVYSSQLGQVNRKLRRSAVVWVFETLNANGFPTSRRNARESLF